MLNETHRIFTIVLVKNYTSEIAQNRLYKNSSNNLVTYKFHYFACFAKKFDI